MYRPDPDSRLIFAGEFEHRIDQQGRISIPSRFRSAFEDGIVLTKAYDHCVNVYTPGHWQETAESLAEQPVTRAASRRLNRFVFSGAYPSTLDRSGRVLVPPQLREYAGLGENVVIAGAGQFLEIWDSAAWQQESELLDEQPAEIAEASPSHGGSSTSSTGAGGRDGA